MGPDRPRGSLRQRLYFSRFPPTQEAGGGSRRLLQLLADTDGLGLELVSSPRGLNRLPDESLERIRQTVDRELAAGISEVDDWSSGKRRSTMRLREISRAWASELPGLADLELAVLDDPVYFQPLLDALLPAGVPVVAFSQNMESLAPEQVRAEMQFELLRRETRALASCRLVVTVSREESWLLTNLGIANLCHPYFPVAPLRDRLLAVRRRREMSRKGGFLMLGNAGNLQTVVGMSQVMRHWQREHLADSLGPLQVAGFHLERHFAFGQFGPGIELLGQLGDPELDERLVTARACLCYQENGAGALTRITEMLLAGVPVVANSHAARSHHGAPGLVEFPHLDALAGALSGLERGDPDFPPPVPPDGESLRRAVLACCAF